MARKPSRFRLRFETVGSITAIVVGVAALYVSWDQARVMRAQQHASVLPAIQIDGFQTRDGEMASIGLRIRNAGVGPAIVSSVALTRLDQPSEDIAPITALLPDGSNLSWSTMIGRVIAAGETVEAISFYWPADALSAEQSAELATEWTSWDVSVCYCSVFERCWIAETRGVGAGARNVPACPAPDYDLFERIGAQGL
ncbi:MAG: hypothetical protein ACQRW7_04185 [Caulobacterales bacterium]|uniref:hypothetical protein n=1 Tax=Glycocaulis sp. TaxID=1969725 RepID=UPI003F9F3855